MASAISTRHFILGLLTRQPMSGYDIKLSLKNLNWLIGGPSFGSLYSALHALLEDGLVTVKVISGQERPSRKIYSITDQGRQALREWLDQPIATGSSLKAFVMRLVLASNLSRADLIAHLQQRRTEVADQQQALEQAIGEKNDDVDLGKRLALDYGLAVAAAELAWLDRQLARFAASSAEVVQSKFAVPTV